MSTARDENVRTLAAALGATEQHAAALLDTVVLLTVAYSGRIRAVIPAGSGQGFRNDAGAKSGAIWALIPV